MKTDGEDFLESKSEPRPGSFDYKFQDACCELGLGCKLNRTELALLRHAAFHATLCNIAFNGLGGCGGEIKPCRENHRRNLEAKFMEARKALCSSAGWKWLSLPIKQEITRRLLRVRIAETNLAW